MPGNYFFGYESSEEDMTFDLEEHDQSDDPEEHEDPWEPDDQNEPLLPTDEAPVRSIFRFGCSDDSDNITAADPNEIAEPLEARRHEQNFESEGHSDRQEPVVSDTSLLTANRAHVSRIFRFGCLDDSITATETPDGSTEPLEVSDDAAEKVPGFLGNIEDNYLAQDVEQKNFNRDVEQDVREIRALLSIHAEILARCARNATLSEGKMTIARLGFEEIRTRQTGSRLELFTRPERSERTFDIAALSELPSGLEETLAVRGRDGPLRGLIDYEDLFRKALILLCDDALGLFLPRLREHLELALAQLEDAESWVLQPRDNASFMEKVFMKKLERPDASVSVGEPVRHGPCDGPSMRRASGEGGDRRSPRECEAERALAECTVSGTYATTFNLSIGSERTRLLRFLFYVCG